MKNYIILTLCVLLFACQVQDQAYSDSDNSQGISNPDGQENLTGKGGSTTKFTIVGNFLYVVESDQLKTFDISIKETLEGEAAVDQGPTLISIINISDELETIFPYDYKGNKVLLLGAQNGMHIFEIKENGIPDNGLNIVLAHRRSCDPVIANKDTHKAYITLRASQVGCITGSNELQVVDITNIDSPSVQTHIPMDGPKGLSFSNQSEALLVCDQYSLKIFSLNDPINPELKGSMPTIQCDDILEYKEHYIVTGPDLLQIYSFDNQEFLLKLETDLLDQEI